MLKHSTRNFRATSVNTRKYMEFNIEILVPLAMRWRHCGRRQVTPPASQIRNPLPPTRIASVRPQS